MNLANGNILVFSDTKASSLLHENIIPVELSHLILMRDNGDPELFDLLKKLLPKSLINNQSSRGVNDDIMSYISRYLVAFPNCLGVSELPSGETFEQRAEKHLPELIDNLHNILETTSEPVKNIIGVPNIKVSGETVSDVSVAISGLNLVNASTLSWKHILEFREDKESQKKLRNFQLFLADNYEGKPQQYVVDSLSQKIDEYENTAKKWGIETSEAAMDVVFSSKSLIGLTTAGLLATFGVVPVVPLATTAISLATAVGSVFTVGKLSIGINQKKRELRDFRNNDPVSYLIELKSKTKVDNKKGDS